MTLPWARRMMSHFIVFTVILFCTGVTSEFLPPKLIDFSDFKGWRITASSTCGVGVDSNGNEYHMEEMYCLIDGAHDDSLFNTNKDSAMPSQIKGQFCSTCDPTHPDRNHSAVFALDSSRKWWQSPPLSRGQQYREVNLTIDLGQELLVSYIIIRPANSPRPALWVLEKSRNNGVTYTPWQYFATSLEQCADVFKIKPMQKITHDDTVICDTEQSKLTAPQKSGVNFDRDEIIISLVKNRPSAEDYHKSTILQEWTKATNIRFRFLQPNTHKADLMSLVNEDSSVTRRYFYSVRHITMGSHCVCNGHAGKCNSTNLSMNYTLICECQHNTCGIQCERCCDGFLQKKWRLSTPQDSFTCEPCNCFGHSNECEYDPEVEKKKQSLDIHGNYDGGGVCKNCKHNTMGINCNKCKPGYYRPNGIPLNATDACKRCNCDEKLHKPDFCMDGSGQCECKPHYSPPKCDTCAKGFYGHPACHQCKCDPKRIQISVCDAKTGHCHCKPNFSGKMCESCADGYYNFPYCYSCKCNEKGSESKVCNKVTRQCSCKTHYGGVKCDKCRNGHFDFPKCTRCSCDLEGTHSDICHKKTGVCLCREGYRGKRCDHCKAGRYGYPTCEMCNCSIKGSSSVACDTFGNCSCHSNYFGSKCDQCNHGYYNYPSCFECKCDPIGSSGISCDGNGKCSCKPNFDGMQCNKCKLGYYGFPNCTACNCDPKGVTQDSIGCELKPNGELCPCKKNVKGKLCDECKEHHWNLTASNPEGCEDCNCNKSGVVGHTGICEPHAGKCPCKYLVESHKCQKCRGGAFNLRADNILGCSDCECNVGGSVNRSCDDATGQCHCKPNVEGQRCSSAVDGYYFPTLHQFKFEAEEGRASKDDAIQYSFNETEFPGYSWKGYVAFSDFQNQLEIYIEIDKQNMYQVIFHCLNIEENPIMVTVTLTPEGATSGSKKTSQVMIQPSKKPLFITVMGSFRNLTSPMLWATGKWSLSIRTDSHLFLDYVVIIPMNYYEATALTHTVNNPCAIQEYEKGEFRICRHFCYPKVSHFKMALGKSESHTRSMLRLGDCLDYEKVFENTVKFNFSLEGTNNHKMKFKLELSKHGEYVLVLIYHTQGNNSSAFDMSVETSSSKGKNFGKTNLHPCNYSFPCRQVIQDEGDKIKIFDFSKKDINVLLTCKGKGFLEIISIVAISHSEWSLDYIKPKPACVKANGKCLPATMDDISHSKKIHLASVLMQKKNRTLPYGLTDSKKQLIHLDIKDEIINLKGNSSPPGKYAFVLHYYQPDYPGFDMKILVNSGETYEAKVHTAHCPSHSGCYSAVEKMDGSKYFALNDKFLFTLKKLHHATVWLEHLIIVPEKRYEESVQPYDEETGLSNLFITHCIEEGLHISNNTNEFCRDSLFSITTKYNDGPLPCKCNLEGSESSQCEKFGGQCLCKANVIGRTCEQCRTGFFGFPDCKPCDCPTGLLCDPKNGSCICPPHTIGEHCEKCAKFSYGHEPLKGCKKCDCNELGVEGNQLQCDILSGECQCQENIEGRTCDHCSPGFSSFPKCAQCTCSVAGTMPQICDKDTGQCICKKFAVGHACGLCQEGTFNLDEKNPDGCTPCFCFNRTKNCTSSSLFKTKVFNMKDWHLTEVNIKKGWLGGAEVFLSHYEKEPKMTENGIQVNFASKEEFKRVLYFAAPSSYLGNKLVSYGAVFNYSINIVDDTLPATSDASDIILFGDGVYLFHNTPSKTLSDPNTMFTVNFNEKSFKVLDQTPSTRDLFMATLRNLEGLFIRVPKIGTPTNISLSDVVLETADDSSTSEMEKALSVEHCNCPENYTGLSCEECAPGYYHSKARKYGGECVLCQCNGHANSCDTQTGVCLNCEHNTTGDHCEKCRRGYYGHPTRGTPYDCQRCACPLTISSNNFAEECELLDDGVSIKCDCSSEYTGTRCEICAVGYYGKPDEMGEVCKPCDCFGNINHQEHGSCDPVSGKCMKCLNNTYGDDCSQCAPGYYGDAIHSKNCQECSCNMCGTDSCHGRTGACECKEHVIGKKCDSCAPNYWNFSSCHGCTPCNCQPASVSSQCNILSGQCECPIGVTGLTCDQCALGYWNYSSDGCTHCKCAKKFSNGGTCDAKTGQCQCSKNLIGKKCDNCPWGWILDPEQGCLECDQCIHTLLNGSDTSIISKLILDIKSLEEEYHANQKITFIKKIVSELQPLVSTLIPTDFDTQSLVEDVTMLKEDATKLKKMSEIVKGKMAKLQIDGLEILIEVTEAETEINKTIAQVNETVMKTKSLTFNVIETDSQYIKEAQIILQKIRGYNFSSIQNSFSREMEKCKKYLDLVQKLESPVNNQTHHLKSMRENVLHLFVKLEDLKNESAKAADSIERASDLNNKMGIPQVRNKIDILMNLTEEVNSALTLAQLYLKNATEIHSGIGSANENLSMMKEKLVQLISLIKTKYHNNEKELSELSKLVNAAKDHADTLIEMVEEISGIFSNISSTSEHAAEAINIDKIINEVKSAMETAEIAKSRGYEAYNMTEGVSVKATISTERSSELLLNAKAKINITQTVLMPNLKMCQGQMDDVYHANKYINGSMKNINGTLQSILSKDTYSLIENAFNSADSSENKSKDALSKIIDIADKTPGQLEIAKGLLEILDEANTNITLAKNEDKRRHNQFPKLIAQLDHIKKEQESVRNAESILKEQINRLQKQIDYARDKIKRIDVGVKLSSMSHLVLRNPPALSDLETSGKISLYFRTNATDGLLLYLGNEKGTSAQARTFKTDDYIALQIENGSPTLTVDLGSGVAVVSIDKYVADNHWYQAIAKRSGKSVKLIIREEVKFDGEEKEKKYENSVVLDGSSSILNLDQDLSRLIVGGYPSDYKIQSKIKNSFFIGDIEELHINDNPVSLWNFILAKEVNGATQRDELILLQPETGLKFEGDGYAILSWPTYTMKAENTIQLRFKTIAQDGLLMLVEKNGSFLSIELINGKVVHRFNLGDEVVTLESKKSYDDDMWHSVEATRSRKSALLMVDEEDRVYNGSSGMAQYLIVSDYIYFGGYPGEHNLPEVTQNKFHGCIDGVMIESTIADLSQNIKAFGITPGCPTEVTNIVSFVKKYSGYVRWTKKMVDGSFQLNFRFKSTQESALLFYATDPSQMNSISLSLVNGVLILNGPQGILVSSSSQASLDPIKYNDDRWHTVTATYASNVLILEIDDLRHFKSRKRGPSQIFGHEDQVLSVYFGGVPDGFNIKATHLNNIPFIGCMGDATFGSDVINFANASKSYNIILGKCVTNGSIFVKRPDTRPSVDEGCSLPMKSIPDQELVSVNSYRFGTRPHSHLVFLKPPNILSHKYKFEVEFNTIEEEGIIFYLTSNDHKTFLALYLHHGKPYYKLGCEDGSKAPIKISKKMNDGLWHTVAISRHTLKAKITVGQYNRSGNSQCPTAWMKNVSSYFIGGIPQSMVVNVMKNLGLNKSFSGCLRNPRDSTLGVLQPDAAHSVIPCSEQVEKGIFFSADGGHVIIDDKFVVGTQIVIGMEIKPRSLSGVLMSVHGKKDYLVLQMYKGAVLFNVENGKGNIFTEYKPSNQSFLCNGEWHKILAIKNKNMISLSVDSSEMTIVNGPIHARSTDTHDPLYLGGHAIMHVKKSGLKPRRQFVGCIRNISINSTLINMAHTNPVGNVTMGVCPTI